VSGLGVWPAPVDVGVALPHPPASPGLRLLPALGTPSLLPPPDGAPRSRDPAAAGEHVQGKQPHAARLPGPGDRQRVLCTAQAWGSCSSGFKEQKACLPLTEAADKSRGWCWQRASMSRDAQALPQPGQCQCPCAMAHQSLLCRAKGPPAPARTPTLPSSCWQCWGAVRWTLPRWGIPCGTSA